MAKPATRKENIGVQAGILLEINAAVAAVLNKHFDPYFDKDNAIRIVRAWAFMRLLDERVPTHHAKVAVEDRPISYDTLVTFCRAAHDALEDALGDIDTTRVDDDEELRAEHPVQWAAMMLAHGITLAHGWDNE